MTIHREIHAVAVFAGMFACLGFAAGADAETGGGVQEIGRASISPVSGAGVTTIDPASRTLLYLDPFDRYPTSDDPVFDRFQVSMHDRANGAGGFWTAFDKEFLTSLFIANQMDGAGAPDPLPRWFGADLIDAQGKAILGDITGDFQVDSADLGILIGSFGRVGEDIAADLNNDGRVDTADLGLLLAAFGQGLGPFCIYEVALAREITPDGVIIPQATLDMAPAIGDRIAIPSDAGPCGLCDEYRFLPDGEPLPVYGKWTLVEDGAGNANTAEYIAQPISQSCQGWGDEHALVLARTESQLNIPTCCFYSLFSPLGRQTTASPIEDVRTQADLFLTGHQTFLWFQGVNNSIIPSWDIMLGGVALFLDPNLLPFANQDGELDCFIVRQSSQASSTGQPLFFGTVPDPISGAAGKKALLGEWFTIRMVQHANSTFELWVRDSETMILNDPNPGDDSDGVADDGFARLVPDGPYGPAIWNQQPGIAAPNPFLVATPALRQLQWLWGGDPSPAEDPEYVPANWFMDNLRVTGPF
ncbi:MAG: hypothetical protein H6813_00480 [Phycisphaeraceae bacterium]|nr:hypothetical protein [Phycisphaeraceae bacterium]MCB9847439.1 hypothetical protein [Phycisphaeraceae bacterium]